MSQYNPAQGNGKPPRQKAGIPVWGIILVVIGILLLLQTTGLVSWDIWGQLWRFWPVLLIAIGVNLLLGRRAPLLAGLVIVLLLLGALIGAYALSARIPGLVSSTFTEPLGEVKSLATKIEFGAGDLKIRALPASSPNLIEARFQTPGRGAVTRLVRSGSTGSLRIQTAPGGFARGFSGADWDIALSPVPKLSLEVEGGAANMIMDLQDLHVSELNLDIGAADLNLAMPAKAGEVKAVINAGAASLTVTVPEGVAAKITSSSAITSFTVDTSRFPQVGNAYASPNFDTTENRITIDFRVGAASVRVQ